MQDEFQLSATCEALLRMERSKKVPSPPQLVPTEPLQQPAPKQHSEEVDRPPPKKRARKSAQYQQDETELIQVIGETTKQLATTCTREHVDIRDPTHAFAFHLSHELATLPAHLRSDAKFELHRVIHDFQVRARLSSDELIP